jgi:Flp pilus assembly protein TadD/peroxiredoxin
MPLWAQAAKPRGCQLHTGATFAPFAQRFIEQIPPGGDQFVTEKYAAEIESLLGGWTRSLTSPHLHNSEGQTHGAAGVGHPIARLLAANLKGFHIDEAVLTPSRTDEPLTSVKTTYGPPVALDGAVFAEHIARSLATLGPIEIAETRMSGIAVLAESPLQVRTTVNYLLMGRPSEQQREQRTGAWEIVWKRSDNGAWMVTEWTPVDEGRSRLTGPGFVDVTGHTLGGNASLAEQLDHGIDYWRTVLDGACAVDIYGNNGISVGDFEGSGFDGIYVCQPSGLPNRLFRNRGDGTFEDVTEKAGVGVIDATSSAVFADLRNMGRQDLIVVRANGPLLFLNGGDGTFELKRDAFRFAKPPQGSFTAVAVADYDRDGLLDVYFGLYSYYQGLSDYQFPTPYYDAQNGPPNFLFHNHGDGTFDDVTEATGMNVSNNRYTLACSWTDYNQDGHPDLYVVNDFGRKVLYRNNGNGTFSDVSAEAGVEDPGEGMSSTWFDYDNDGFEDLYSVNMWEAAGKRVTSQPQFMPGVDQHIREIYRRDAGGNSLLHHNGASATFTDVTDNSGTRVGGWNWSSGAWDVDHDGYQDLYVANGFISGPNRTDLSSFYWRQIVTHSLEGGGRSKNYEDAWSTINEGIRSDYTWSGYQRNNLYLNNRDGSLIESASILGLDCLEDGRSFSLADIDGDGRLEVIVKNRTGPQVRVFHNQMKLTGRSISVTLKGTKSNRDAVGAVVVLKTAAGTQRQTVTAGSGFLSQHSKTLVFGLGAHEGKVSCTVHWPNGSVQAVPELDPQHRIYIEEGNATLRSVPFAAVPTHEENSAAPAVDDLDAASETWSVDPIAVPEFKLPTARGGAVGSDSLRGATLLVLFGASCPESARLLREVETEVPEWKRHGLDVIAIAAEEPGPAGATPSRAFSFPVLQADEKTRNVFNVFYRYLFERRRDITLPTAFLLNERREVLKTYTGAFAPSKVLGDLRSSPVDAAGRMKKALPFPGNFYGAGFHHNYFTYGVAYLQYDLLDQALVSFQRAIAINPSQAGAYYNVGIIYLNRDMLDEARTNLEKTVELDPSDANAWNNLGVVAGEKEDYDTAQRYFEKTLSLRPAHLLALQNLSKLYVYKGRPDDAQKILEAAISSEPSDPQLHFELAMFFIQQKKNADAQREFESTLRLQPNNVPALNGLGVLQMRQGDLAGAMKDFAQCNRLDPDFDRPYINMAAIFLKGGERQRAHDLLADYLQRHPDNQEVADVLKQIDGAK